MNYAWYVDSGELKFIDSYSNEATLTPVTVKYRKRLYNEISSQAEDILSVLTVSSVGFTLVADGIGVGEAYFYFVDPLLDSSGAPNSLDTLYYINSKKLYIEGVEQDVADYTAGSYSVVLVENMWEEQDDGLDGDLQMAALYFALSRAADMVGGDREVSKYFFDKYNYMTKDLRRKYNASKFKNITIKPYDF